MHIVMIGTGYVGLVSGACFADIGHRVVCVDRDQDKIADLGRGKVGIYEAGLDVLVARNLKAKRLSFSSNLAKALDGATAAFICVGTPERPGDGHSDLSFVHQVAREVAAAASGPLIVVNKSTVPVGTGDEVEHILRTRRPDIAFSVVSNPEFLREGAGVADFQKPDRIVIGSADAATRATMLELYRPLAPDPAIVLFTSRRTAELIKYAANTFLAIKLGFINEMADLSEAVGADVQDVARGIGMDDRIGPRFLNAGPGFGGSCLRKDVSALIKTSQDAGTQLRIVEGVANANARRPRTMARKVIAACGGSVRGRTIAILGLTFKPETDDMRDAPSLPIIAALQDAGAMIRAFDPVGMETARPLVRDVEFCADAYACAQGADVAVIITEWNQFRTLDLVRLKAALASPVLVDLRNIYRPETVRGLGYTYLSIGRQ